MNLGDSAYDASRSWLDDAGRAPPLATGATSRAVAAIP